MFAQRKLSFILSKTFQNSGVQIAVPASNETNRRPRLARSYHFSSVFIFTYLHAFLRKNSPINLASSAATARATLVAS